RTGQGIWTRTFASTQTPWIAGDVLYAVTVDGELAAFDRQTGAVFWVHQLQRFEDQKKKKGRIAWTGPIWIGTKLSLASSTGDVVAINPTSGEVLETRNVKKPIFIPPVAANGAIYLVTDEAELIVLK